MKNDFENQINEVYAELDKFRHKLKFFKLYFATSLLPKPEALEQEQGLVKKLMKYDLSTLVFGCTHLIRQAIDLKEKNMGEEELQEFFKQVRDIVSMARSRKVEGEKLVSLIEETISLKRGDK